MPSQTQNSTGRPDTDARRPSSGLKHILSVDLEDYFQVEAFAGVVSRDDWDRFPSRVESNCQRLLHA